MKNIVVLLLVGVFMGACVKNDMPYVPPVDENFDWKTTVSVAFSIPPASSPGVRGKETSYASTIKIYTSPIYSESSLIASGASFNGEPFETVADLPKNTEQVFVKIISPEGLITLTTYDVVGNKGVKSAAPRLGVKGGVVAAPEIPKPKFPAKYDVTFTKNEDLGSTLTKSGSYHIPAGTKLTHGNTQLLTNWVAGATPVLYVGGSLVIGPGNAVIPIAYASIVVLKGGSVTFMGSVDINQMHTDTKNPVIYVQQGGVLTVKGGVSASTKMSIVNEGTMKVGSAFNFANAVSFYNTGKLNLGREFALSTGAVCHNTGVVEAEKVSIRNSSSFFNYGGAGKNAELELESLEITNSEGYFYQHGFVEIEETFTAKGKVENYGRMECKTLTDGTTFNYQGYAGSLLKIEQLHGLSNSTFTLEPGSILFIYKNGNGNGNSNNWNVKFVNPVTNGKDYALILWGVSDEKEDNTIINDKNELSFTGNIENYCPKKTDSQNEKYTKELCTNHAFWGGRTHHIPDSDYNEGLGNNGGDEPVDKDGDGVPEGEDVDDNDPTVTHVSYFPSAGVWGTYFFEDLWPNIGDYDMNDIVLDFRIAYFTKGAPAAGNPVVYMELDWRLRAVGSQMQLAMGIQLDKVTPEQVAGLNTNHSKLGQEPIDRKGVHGLESGQSKAVFALFNNPAELFEASTGINVFRGAPKLLPTEQKTRIRFKNGVAKEDLSIGHINPFIVVSSKTNPDRGHEIHLSTNPATDKMNTAYYQQGFVSRNNPFKATNGMVWGYMVPEPFHYPAEMVTISKAYPNFAKWYQSAGAEHSEWYDTSVSGNVVQEYLYEPVSF